MLQYLIPFLAAFGSAVVLMPAARTIALRIGFVDRPTGRKIHSQPVPLLGGIVIFFSIVCSLWLFEGPNSLTLAITTGGTLLLLTGLADDYAKTKGRDFPVGPRVAVYLAASAVPVLFGIQIVGISNLSGGMFLFPGWLAWLATMLWVFALMNMINFIDGVDGLASGIVAISSLTLFFVAMMKGQADSAQLAVVIVGATVAFLMYNFHPAKIFMGDAGAVFLGYTLSVLSIDGALKGATFVTVGVSMLALGVPIMDTLVVFARRIAEKKGLHRADQLHTHHSLMKWGLTQTQTASFLYLIGGLFSLLSIIVFLLFR
jgi:UDP-GlcNAc:undecaprenyl-phosphate GlcNAc-1-phosphate transferase